MSSRLTKIVRGSTSATHINEYVQKGDYCELHIKGTDDTGNTDVVIILDNEDVEGVSQHFWGYGFCGRKGYKKPQIYYIKDRKKVYLSRFILDCDDCNKIIFVNRNPLDYRRDNLEILRDGDIPYRDRNKHNCIGMNNIRRLYRNQICIAFQVMYKTKNGIDKARSFNIKKLGNEEKALIEAMNFRDSLLQSAI